MKGLARAFCDIKVSNKKWNYNKSLCKLNTDLLEQEEDLVIDVKVDLGISLRQSDKWDTASELFIAIFRED